MPNSLQLLFLLSAFLSFSVLYFSTHYFFPGLLPRIDPAILFSSYQKVPPPPPPTTFEKIAMSASSVLGVNDWKDLLEGQKLLGLVLSSLTAVVLGLWLAGGKKRKPVLDTKEYREFPLVEKIVISPNTALYRFGLPRSDDVIGLPIGQHLTIAADIDGKTVARSYTPTSSNEDTGHFDLVVKSYEKGNISKYVGNLKLGDKIRVRGPKGQFKYSPGSISEFSMIAGGTGITPMYQIITHVLYNHKDDKTKINLIYANVNFEDILLKAELDELAKTYKDRFRIYYVLNNPPVSWNGGVGFVSKEMIDERLHRHAEGKQMLICGPPPMVTAMKKHLGDLNFPPAQTISKAGDAIPLGARTPLPLLFARPNSSRAVKKDASGERNWDRFSVTLHVRLLKVVPLALVESRVLRITEEHTHLCCKMGVLLVSNENPSLLAVIPQAITAAARFVGRPTSVDCTKAAYTGPAIDAQALSDQIYPKRAD
ncbi:NADH-cytochrome b5 reductase [Tulasnella sp. 427]|nr:NADH-cytochrome b5 reductase [Tulasnella sp. 427]